MGVPRDWAFRSHGEAPDARSHLLEQLDPLRRQLGVERRTVRSDCRPDGPDSPPVLPRRDLRQWPRRSGWCWSPAEGRLPPMTPPRRSAPPRRGPARRPARDTVRTSLRVAVFDGEVLPFDPAEVAHALPERVSKLVTHPPVGSLGERYPMRLIVAGCRVGDGSTPHPARRPTPARAALRWRK